MFSLLHADFGWVIAGLVVFVGIIVFIHNIMAGKMLRTMCSSLVWFFVFTIHSGSTQGIMTATFAALLFDTIGYPLLGALLRGGKK